MSPTRKKLEISTLSQVILNTLNILKDGTRPLIRLRACQLAYFPDNH